MYYFDDSVIYFLNGFSRLSEGFDYFMSLLIRNHLFKGGIMMTMLWWFWFRDNSGKNQNQSLPESSEKKQKQSLPGSREKKQKQTIPESKNEKQTQLLRERIILMFASSLAAIFLARFMAYILPFRLRPLHNKLLHFIAPYGISPNALDSWSSFPSDHAVLFFALATGIFFISRITGILVTIYVILVICFPRLYCGLHYPTDILAGALIGIGIGWLFNATKISRLITQPAMHWLSKEPGSFYACFFFLTYQIAVMFDPVREILIFLMCLFKPV